MAEALKTEPGVEVSLIDGKLGELTVLADDQVVAKKGWFRMPDPQKVREAVKAQTPVS